MRFSSSRLLILIGVLIFLIITFIFLDRYCPSSGLALSESRRTVHRLKNRTSFPQPSEFDSQVTLSNILAPGRDEMRWSQTKAARVEGYVVSVGRASIELANCYSPCRRDIHINVALRPDAAPSEQMVLEVTPYFERLNASQGLDWSEQRLKQTLVGHWCRFEGWLFYDIGHDEEATNTHKGGSNIWRATGWEIHPVTKIEVIK